MSDDAQGKESTEFIDSLFNHAYTNIPYALRVINPMTDYNQFEKVTSYLEKYQNGEEVDSSELGKDAIKYEHCVEWLEKKDAGSSRRLDAAGKSEFCIPDFKRNYR